YLGQPQMRRFDIRGGGPRVQRQSYLFNEDGTPTKDAAGNFVTDSTRKNLLADDAIGGRAYYLGHIEMQIPLGAGVRELGIRPSGFMDIGSGLGVKRPVLTDLPPGDPRLVRDIVDANGNAQCTVPAVPPSTS